MAMIQGIDGGLLINALRQGREDRYQTDQRELAAARAQAEQQRQQKVQTLTRQAVGGGPAPEGVMGQYQAGAGVASAFGQAPGAAPVAKPDPSAMNELLVLDPEQFGRLQANFKAMDEASLKKSQTKNDAMGSAALYLQKIKPQDRAAAMQRIAPQLMQAGWTQEEIAAAELSDEALMGYRAFGVDFDKAVANERKEREFLAGKTLALPEGGSVANTRPTFSSTGEFTGNVTETIVAANPGDKPTGAPVETPTTPVTKVIGDKTYYRDDKGQWHDTPIGGASGNVGGGFSGFKRAIIAQESGGRYGVTNAEGSGAMGVGQIMPETGAALAKREGLPWRPDLMRGNSAEARAYQDRLTDAALKEAWNYGGGDPEKAAKYYFAGPNRKGWGPKTKVYGESVVRRMRAR